MEETVADVGAEVKGEEAPALVVYMAWTKEAEEEGKTLLSAFKERMDVRYAGCSESYVETAAVVTQKTALAPVDTREGLFVTSFAQGVAMAANRCPGIRAVVCRTEEEAVFAREHYLANHLVLEPGAVLHAAEIASAFFSTPHGCADKAKQRAAMVDVFGGASWQGFLVPPGSKEAEEGGGGAADAPKKGWRRKKKVKGKARLAGGRRV